MRLLYVVLASFILLHTLAYAENKLPNVTIEIDKDKSVSTQSLLKELRSALKKHRKEDVSYQYYSSPAQIARADKKFATLWLESKGFYSAQISTQSSTLKLIELNVLPGSQYTIKNLTINHSSGIKVPITLENLKQKDSLIASDVLRAKSEIAQYVKNNNCLFNIKVDYQATVAIDEPLANVVFNIMESPQVNYGDISWEGLKTVKDSVIENLLKLKKGRCFKRTELDQQRIEFLRSSLIANATQELTLDQSANLVNIHYVFTEAQHKTIKTGVAMVTDEGLEVSGSWENRNVFGSGERLLIDIAVNPKNKIIKSELEFPNFYSEKNNLLLNAEIEDHELEAYETKGLSLSANLRRMITSRSYGQLGIKYKHSEITQQDEQEKFDILSLPISYVIDTTKNPLDPRTGAKAEWLLEHFLVLSGEASDFTKFNFSLSGYKTANQLVWQPTLAAKLSSGLISNIKNSELIPANELYFVGGGGSVRGYPYQTLGPLYQNNDPAGGLSYAELSLEGRFHVTQQWGFAIFTEGGSAFIENSPAFDSRWKWSAGFGMRYYTGFAPMRIDLAFPLSKRKGIDDSFQLYISIGEAF